MRAIDADALINRIVFHTDWPTDEKEAFEDEINAEPTIEERKKGKWINHRNDDGHNIADCSVCGNPIQWFDPDTTPNYCPNCGSYNGGEQDEMEI